MHFLLIYDVGLDFLQRRSEFRDEHLELAWKYCEQGTLILGGALQEPTDQVFLLFQSKSEETAKGFAEADPYVRHGVVKCWRVRQWNTVVGETAVTPQWPTQK